MNNKQKQTWVETLIPEVEWWAINLGPSLGYNVIHLPIPVFFWEQEKIRTIRDRRRV